MTEEQERAIRKGQQAQRLLDDELIREFLATERAELLQRWVASPPRDADGREHIWRLYRALDAMVGHLQGLSATGKMNHPDMVAEQTMRDASGLGIVPT